MTQTDHAQSDNAQTEKAQFWNQVLAIAEQIESGGSDQDLNEMAGMLLGLIEGFDALADPVETFEEYSVIRLSRAIHDVLYSRAAIRQSR